MPTTQTDVDRARTHDWFELNDQTDMCSKCKLILPKSTLVENVPACTGRRFA